MMEAETKDALAATGSDAEVIWMEKGLHNKPENLCVVLQKTIEQAEKDYAPDVILLGYGLCGNAMRGLHADTCRLVLPRIDDCLTMFIGSRERKARLENGKGIMFQTADWADGDKSIAEIRNSLYERFDEDEADELWEMMYGNYDRIGVLDTHCYDLAPVVEKTKKAAEFLGFDHQVYDATTDFLKELLLPPWPEERFIVKEPGEVISGQDLRV